MVVVVIEMKTFDAVAMPATTTACQHHTRVATINNNSSRRQTLCRRHRLNRQTLTTQIKAAVAVTSTDRARPEACSDRLTTIKTTSMINNSTVVVVAIIMPRRKAVTSLAIIIPRRKAVTSLAKESPFSIYHRW